MKLLLDTHAFLWYVLDEAWTAPPGEDQRLLDKAGELAGLVSRLWREVGPPCSSRVLDRALACAQARSTAPERIDWRCA